MCLVLISDFFLFLIIASLSEFKYRIPFPMWSTIYRSEYKVSYRAISLLMLIVDLVCEEIIGQLVSL